ncbi:hypothetical protein J6590_036123 [Homalodisca vitripennis]|nr:hypothetical protein J6590_036123 [Homalodisca vitripennis]
MAQPLVTPTDVRSPIKWVYDVRLIRRDCTWRQIRCSYCMDYNCSIYDLPYVCDHDTSCLYDTVRRDRVRTPNLGYTCDSCCLPFMSRVSDASTTPHSLSRALLSLSYLIGCDNCAPGSPPRHYRGTIAAKGAGVCEVSRAAANHKLIHPFSTSPERGGGGEACCAPATLFLRV